MKLWIDCEFNEFQGALISMALVDEQGREWYEVLPCENPGAWVAEHVMPILGKQPVPREVAQASLQAWLAVYPGIHVIADWPEDIAHFNQFLITGPGTRLNTPALTMEVVRIDAPSELPHNALADARGIRDHMERNSLLADRNSRRAMYCALESQLAELQGRVAVNESFSVFLGFSIMAVVVLVAIAIAIGDLP